MTILRTVSLALVGSLLITAAPKAVWANEEVTSSASVELRTAIDRAAAHYVTQSRERSTDLRLASPAARASQMGGGGGGKGMMIWTVVGTVTSLAATYFVIKEVRKQTEQVTPQ